MTTKHPATKSAGRFSVWLKDTTNSREADVPCGECSACCHSSYFVHITPADTDAIKHIPKDLTFAAPGLPKGHMLMGYDENGRCPMFVDNKCSIYPYRPQTCRHYDCRVFPATGIDIKESGKEQIAQQAKQWQFEFADDHDRQTFQAVQAAAKFINTHAAAFPSDFLPSNTTQQAILATSIHHLFLDANLTSQNDVNKTVKLIMASCQENT